MAKDRVVKRLILLWLLFLFYTGCSDVGFEIRQSSSCQEAPLKGIVCSQGEDGINHYSTEFVSGKVDVIFVIDNSGSMSVEQKQMAQRLGNLLEKINLAQMDYRIAVITTDVKKDKGQFLKFPDGSLFLTPQSPKVLEQLKQTIQRQETLTCDQNNYNPSMCPSGDERGIYALNLALDRPENTSFFRDSAHLSVILLSDEDERSAGGTLSGFPLEPYDLPETLIQKVALQLGMTKTFSFHSVIVKPGDAQCLNAQIVHLPNGRNLYGYYGKTYAKLSRPSDNLKALGGLVDGTIGSICASDYAAQMGDIGSRVSEVVDSYQLPCEPIDNSLTVEISERGNAFTEIPFEVDNNLMIHFNPPLPAGTRVKIRWSCPNYL
ncbi:MAG: hypothetical protein D6797_08760 [Bdellovibrio sp.]|nr:MAG: hypothetical protein D6797_08760 [Bdellovibrio sp.]